MFEPITNTIIVEGRPVEVALFQKDGQPMCWADKQGNVYSVKREKPIAQFIDIVSGYMKFRVYHIKGFPNVQVHRAVLTAWRGPCPSGCECDHINSIKTDNRLCNLRWLSSKENLARRRKKVLYSYRIEIYDRANLTPLLMTSSVKETVVFLSGDPFKQSNHNIHGRALERLRECTDHVINTRNYQIIVSKWKRKPKNAR